MSASEASSRDQVQRLLVTAESHYNDIIDQFDSEKLDVKDRNVFYDCKEEFLEYRTVIISYLRKHQGDVRVMTKIIQGHLLSDERKRAALANVFYRPHTALQGKTQFQTMHEELSASIERVIEVLRKLEIFQRCIGQRKYKGVFKHIVVSVSGMMVSLLGLAALVIPGLQILAPIMVIEGASYAYLGSGALVTAFGFNKLRRANKHRAVDVALLRTLKDIARKLHNDAETAHTASLKHEELFNARLSEASLSEFTFFDPTDLDFFLRFAESFEALWDAVITYPKPLAAYSPVLAERAHSAEATMMGCTAVQTYNVVPQSEGERAALLGQHHYSASAESCSDGFLVSVC